MPELPEVETIVRQLRKPLKNRVFKGVKVYDKRVILPHKPANFSQQIIGKKINQLNRRGKLMLMDLSDGKVLAVHLKMTGQLIINGSSDKHTRAAFVLDNGRDLLYNDQRRFGYLKIYDRSAIDDLLKKFGPEPLGDNFSPEILSTAMQKRKASIKNLLLNQKIVAGLGNIYVDEILHQARLHPARPAHSLKKSDFRKIYMATVQVLTAAIEAKGSSSKNYVDADGRQGDYQNHHRVYNREGKSCPGCKGKIKKITLAGRGTHFCPSCQK